jgi:hypothetical protein
MHYYMNYYSTYYSTYYALLNYFNKLCTIVFPIMHYDLKYNILISLFYGATPSLRVPLHTNPGPVQICLTDHSTARTDVHLDMQEGVQYDHTSGSSPPRIS